MKQNDEYAIRVKDLYKDFKLNSDKARTLKERILFSKRNKQERIQILNK